MLHHTRRASWVGVLAIVACAVACGGGGEGVTTLDSDATAARDGGPSNPAPSDAATTGDAAPSPDASAPANASAPGDAGPFGDILGTLTGSCGQVRAEVGKPTPSALVNTLTFVTGEVFDKAFLSDGGDTVFDNPNAGGSSIESEVMSFEKSSPLRGRAAPEDQDPRSCTAPRPTVGRRASPICWSDRRQEGGREPAPGLQAREPAPAHRGGDQDLERKLLNIQASSARVSAGDKWVKRIMHVMTASQANLDAVMRVLPPSTPPHAPTQ